MIAGTATAAPDHRHHEVLRRSRERFRRAFTDSPDGVATIDLPEGRYVEVNRRFTVVTGHAFPALCGRSFAAIPLWEGEPRQETLLDEVKRTGPALERPITLVPRSGEKQAARLSAMVMRLEERPLLLLVIRPVGELRRVEAALEKSESRYRDLCKQMLTYQKKLQSLASELSLVEERERRAIATDLHDRIGQTLTVIRMKLHEARQLAAAPQTSPAVAPETVAKAVRLLDDLGDLVRQTIRDTRSLTFELSPPVLYELGLEAALEWLADDFRDRHGLAVKVRDDGRPKALSEEVRIILFRAVRELLVNTVKHAGARRVEIETRRDGDSIRIMVEDDGAGFDPAGRSAAPAGHQGFGLFNIKERLNHLGGRLEIDSTPGQGTKATLTAPLKETP